MFKKFSITLLTIFNIGILLGSVFLLTQAVTIRGILLGLSVLGLSFLGVTIPFCSRSFLLNRNLKFIWGISATLTLFNLLCIPSGKNLNSSPVSNRFLKPYSFNHFIITNLIPEIDQLRLGFFILPRLHKILTISQAEKLKNLLTPLYIQMEKDKNFYNLGSVLGSAEAELLGQRNPAEHYYIYIPSNISKKPLPVIVFLHGAGGNFKIYTWLWSQFAQKNGFIIIAPTLGFGDWSRPEGTQLVLKAIDDAAKIAQIDQKKIYLAGLSNGGRGVSRLAGQFPDKFKGLIYISPVIEPHLLNTKIFIDQWLKKPILIISGNEDDRIPIQSIEDQTKKWMSSNMDITLHLYPHEDHFLIFNQTQNIFEIISAWIKRIDL